MNGGSGGGSSTSSVLFPPSGGGAPLAPAPSSVLPGLVLGPQSSSTASTITTNNVQYDRLTPEQHARIQEDFAERERQASALAAAGLVADSVSLTRPNSNAIGQVLHAPPPLAGMPPPHIMQHTTSHATSSGGGTDQSIPLESMNWNFDLGGSALGFGTGGGGVGLDDMDVEFSTLFDTEEEHSLILQSMAFTSSPSPLTISTSPSLPTTSTEIQQQQQQQHGIPNPLNAQSH
jgi:hypothetical protein